MKNIRVRIAPSPTGPLHLGTARAALFNWLFAKKNKGKFVLRVEDTDLKRSAEKYVKEIIESFNWLGLNYDEGPNKKGRFGPYRQSQRIKSYEKYISGLLKSGQAYQCFCSEKELKKEREEQMKRKEPPKYSGKCRNLSSKQINQYQAKGKKSIIRFKIPQKTIVFNDLIRGKLSFKTELIGDFSIARDQKIPLYNLAVVVDDYLMKITHVLRGEDHISNTPKQIILQEALGFSRPQYGHFPLILGPDKSKLSKRHGAVAVSQYKEQGYLPEAMINFMALLGWNPKTEEEIFSLEELIKRFSLGGIQKGGAIFNPERLNWINGHYIRQMKLDELVKKCLPYFNFKKRPNLNYLKKIIALEQPRLKQLSEIGELTDYFFKEKLDYKAQLLIWKKMTPVQVGDSIDKLEKTLSKISADKFNQKNLEKILMPIAENQGDRGVLLWPLRVALSGKKASPGPFEIAEILGKKKTINRIKQAKRKICR